MNVNKITLIGRLTSDPEQRVSQSGVPVTYFTIAISRRIKKDETDFIDCVSFNKTAEFVSKYFRKGSIIFACGSLQIDNYKDKEGKSRKSAKVVVEEVQFGESKKSDTKPAAPTTEQVKIDNDLPDELVEDDELPF